MKRANRGPVSIRQAARTSRRDLRILVLIAAVVATVFLSVGNDSSARRQDAAPDPAEEEATREALEEFAPSERISADRAIAFPVDI